MVSFFTVVYETLSEGGGRPPESNQDILARAPQAVQDIVDKDPILKNNLSQIDINHLIELLSKPENLQIFSQKDNQVPKRDFMIQNIKGLEYGQYASNGEGFEEFLKKYGNAAIDEAEKLVDNGKWTEKDYDNFVKYRKSSNNEALISKKSEGAKIDQEAIKNSENMKKISEFVGAARATLNQSGDAYIESELLKARTDENNPINRELAKSGVSEKDIKSGAYDDMRRASIMVGIVNDPEELKRFRDQGFIKDESGFISSVDKIKEMGIIGSVVSKNPRAIAAHIDSRFPKTEATERSKSEIISSIETGNVQSIIYDGKGEKYTLIDKDGRTAKEIYMDPPRTVIVIGNLSVSRETIKREQTSYERDKSGVENEISTITQAIKKGPFVGALETVGLDSGKGDFALADKATTPQEKLRYTYAALGKKSNALDTLITSMKERGEEGEGRILENAKRQVENQIEQIMNLARKYEKILTNGDAEKRSVDSFDSTARANLAWLIDEKWDRIGPAADTVLERIIREVNTLREDRNKISLATRPLDDGDKRTLRIAYLNLIQNLGYTQGILVDANIGRFREDVMRATSTRGRETRGSIEDLIVARKSEGA